MEAGGDDLYEAASSKIDVAVPLGVMQEDVATSITEEAASVVCRVDLAALQISTTLLPSSSTELPTRSYPSPPKNIAFRSASSATFAPLSAVTHIDDTDDSAMNDPAQRIWEMRGEWIAKRLVTDELPFGERPALVRTSVEMEEYAFLENLYHVRRMLLRGQPVPATVTNSDNTLSPLAADEDAATAAELEPLVDDLYFFPEFCHATGSLPDLYDHAALKRGILGLDDHLLRNDGAVNDLQLISRNPFLADVPVDNRQLFRKTSDET